MARSASKSQIGRGASRRAGRFPVEVRIRCVRALLAFERKQPLSWRVNSRARRFGISTRSLWRWLARYRRGGPDALRDPFRRDLLTRRVTDDVVTKFTGLGSVMLGDRFVFRTEDVFDGSIGKKLDFEGKPLVVVGFMPASYASRVIVRAPGEKIVLLPLEVVEKFLLAQRTATH